MTQPVLMEEIDEGKSKAMYEESLVVLEELYKSGFEGVDFSAEDAYQLQRLQHNIMSNTFWRMTQPEDFPEELLMYRVRIATQAIFLLGRNNALRESQKDV